jgi:hypothetical protein
MRSQLPVEANIGHYLHQQEYLLVERCWETLDSPVTPLILLRFGRRNHNHSTLQRHMQSSPGVASDSNTKPARFRMRNLSSDGCSPNRVVTTFAKARLIPTTAQTRCATMLHHQKSLSIPISSVFLIKVVTLAEELLDASEQSCPWFRFMRRGSMMRFSSSAGSPTIGLSSGGSIPHAPSQEEVINHIDSLPLQP